MRQACSEALDRRLDARSRRPLAVAFSGGSDSLALLVVAKAWADRAGRPLVALIVDHALHPQSAIWTGEATRTAMRLGVAWRSLVWTGDKPATGLPAAARQARHRLLAEAAHGLDAGVILFGHTADDRRESALIREETQGLGTLREWAPSPVWPQGRGVFLLRPLLAARRGDLRAWLQGLGLRWIEDPANVDLRYARSRARAALVASEAASAALDDIGDGDAGSYGGATAILARDVALTMDGRLSVPRTRFVAEARSARRRTTGFALLCAAGGDRPARGDRLDRLIDRLTCGETFTATLSGARIAADPLKVVFAREPGERRRGGRVATPQPVAVQPQPWTVYDGRFELQASAPGLVVWPLAGRVARLCDADAAVVRALPASARGALPVLESSTGAVSLPAPFGTGPAQARSLVGRRFAAACGLVRREAEIGMEQACGAAHTASLCSRTRI